MATNRTQAAIERHLSQLLQNPFDIDKMPIEVFGDLEEWTFEIGPCKFMLIPLNQEWMYWVENLGVWKETGIKVGEAIFTFDGEDLVVRKVIPDERLTNLRLVLRTGDGSLWSVNKEGKAWVKKEGDQWVEARPPFDTESGNHAPDARYSPLPPFPPTQQTPEISETISCSQCGFIIAKDSAFCGKCGTPVKKVAVPIPPLPPQTKVCPNCSKSLGPNTKFCGGCGKPV
jgi:RNA polymerase subunit RPABC4/transcription elongation factor Spt4